jgi:hypothetical protein
MRLSENCKDEYCSDFCKFEDSPKLYPINKMTKERIQFNLIGRVNYPRKLGERK